MGRDGDLKTRSSRNDDGSSNTKCPKGGKRPIELQPDNKVWTLSKRQEKKRGAHLWGSTGQLSPDTTQEDG